MGQLGTDVGSSGQRGVRDDDVRERDLSPSSLVTALEPAIEIAVVSPRQLRPLALLASLDVLELPAVKGREV